jgi:hypothetical protein
MRWFATCRSGAGSATRARVVDFSDRAGLFANLNTPEEFRAWEHRQNG